MYEPHQQRVIEEKIELDQRIRRLAAFFQTEAFVNLVTQEQIHLRAQHAVMRGYSGILAARIVAFPVPAVKVETTKNTYGTRLREHTVAGLQEPGRPPEHPISFYRENVVGESFPAD